MRVCMTFLSDTVELCRTRALRSLNVNGPLKIGTASMAQTAGKPGRGKRPNTVHENHMDFEYNAFSVRSEAFGWLVSFREESDSELHINSRLF